MSIPIDSNFNDSTTQTVPYITKYILGQFSL